MATSPKTTPAKKSTKPAAVKKASAPKTQPVVEPFEAAIKTNTETATKIVKTSTNVAKQNVEKAADASKEQIATAAKVSADTFKGYEDMIALSKENVEAMVQSNGIFSKGVQEINEKILKLVQSNMAQTVDYTQKIISCTSIEAVVALQQEIATVQYSKTVEESKLLSEMTVKLAEKAAKPISDRVNVTIETLSKPIAA